MPDFLKKLLGGLAKEIPVVGGLVSDLLMKTDEELAKLPPEQRVNFELQLKQLSLQEFQTEINAKVDLMKAELAQEDKYVKRARPTGLYIFYVAALTVTVALVAGVSMDTGAILTILGPLGGYGGWYSFNRSQDKRNGKTPS